MWSGIQIDTAEAKKFQWFQQTTKSWKKSMEQISSSQSLEETNFAKALTQTSSHLNF